MVSLTRLMSRLNRESGIKLMLVDACRDDPVEAGKKGLRSLSGNELVGRLPKDSVIVFGCSVRPARLETGQGRQRPRRVLPSRHRRAERQGRRPGDRRGFMGRPRFVSPQEREQKAREWDPENAARADASPRTRGRLQDPQVVSNLIATPILRGSTSSAACPRISPRRRQSHLSPAR